MRPKRIAFTDSTFNSQGVEDIYLPQAQATRNRQSAELGAAIV